MNDRERLIELQKANCKVDKGCETNCLECMADHLISNGVTIQKHGRWVMKDTAYACSECGCGFVAPVSYCFSCGAKMDLEET